MLPDIIGYFPGRQIVEVQDEDVVTCLFLWLCIGLRYLVFKPNKAHYHRPALGNGIGKIALSREDFVAPFVNAPVPLLLLQVSLVRLRVEKASVASSKR